MVAAPYRVIVLFTFLLKSVVDCNTRYDSADKLYFIALIAGDVITRDSGFMRGHGTFTADDVLHASVAGVVERVNKLISVTPLKTRYLGH